MNDMNQQDYNRHAYYIMFYYFPWAAVLFIIFSLSSQPAGNLPNIQNPYLDKIAHIVEYCILGFCTIRVFRLWSQSKSTPTVTALRSIYLLSFSFVVVFGLVDEIHQIFVEGRTFDLIDLAMDGFGMILAIILYRHLAKRQSLV